MNESHEERVADRMNCEPPIFKGCSTSELLFIAVGATAFWFPVSILICALLGAITMGLGIAGVGVVATIVIVASFFQKIKNGRPDGYYQQVCRVWLANKGVQACPLILRSGHWDLGRTNSA
ncbi:MAG: TIGR03750 family conjugal transfer protein [Gammaproteobacteria bacterium]|nr:TIGR03750 family conjugal transfer protein [Gammaproteobacteria bacterium]